MRMRSDRLIASAASLPASPMMTDTMGMGAFSIIDRLLAMALPTPCSSDSSRGSAPWESMKANKGKLNRAARRISRCAFRNPSGRT